jgi:hypothetical protein
MMERTYAQSEVDGMVAAAIQGAAEVIKRNHDKRAIYKNDYKEILALADAPARAALEAMLAEERREAYTTARQMVSFWGSDDGPDLTADADFPYSKGWLDAISYAQEQIRKLEADHAARVAAQEAAP